MLPDALLEQISEASPLAFALVAVAGFVIGLAPSSLPLVSVVAGFAAGQGGAIDASRPARRAWNTGLPISAGFVLGMATVDAALGGLFGLIGYTLITTLAEYRALINLVIAAVLIILGLALLRTIRIALPVPRPTWRPAPSFGSAYALGIPFGLSTCPVCTPMVLPIMAAAAATGTPWLGALLLFTFGLARGVPLVLVGTFAGMLRTLRSPARWIPLIERAGGVLLLLAAVYFLYQSGAYAGILPPLLLATSGS